MKKLTVTICLSLVMVAGTALADWDINDGHKMHYPQLPNHDGWDVYGTTIFKDDGTGNEVIVSQKILADDWVCSQSGDVTDVHIWGSWKEDDVGVIDRVHLSIHDNIQAGEGGIDYSRPGVLLWDRDFFAGEFVIRDPAGSGYQGWFNPNTGEYFRPDHQWFHQINIIDIQDPWYQEVDKVYWLDVTVWVRQAPQGTPQQLWGWKTSGEEQFMDDAVYSDDGDNWSPLTDPELATHPSLDLAFVITPEPATMAILGIGGMVLFSRRQRRQ